MGVVYTYRLATCEIYAIYATNFHIILCRAQTHLRGDLLETIPFVPVILPIAMNRYVHTWLDQPSW